MDNRAKQDKEERQGNCNDLAGLPHPEFLPYFVIVLASHQKKIVTLSNMERLAMFQRSLYGLPKPQAI